MKQALLGFGRFVESGTYAFGRRLACILGVSLFLIFAVQKVEAATVTVKQGPFFDPSQYPAIASISISGYEWAQVGNAYIDDTDTNGETTAITVSNIYKGDNGDWFAEEVYVGYNDSDGNYGNSYHYNFDLGPGPIALMTDSPYGTATVVYNTVAGGYPAGVLDSVTNPSTYRKITLSGWAADLAAGGTAASVVLSGSNYTSTVASSNVTSGAIATIPAQTLGGRTDAVSATGLAATVNTGWTYTLNLVGLQTGRQIYAYAVANGYATPIGGFYLSSVPGSQSNTFMAATPGYGFAPITLTWNIPTNTGSLTLTGPGISGSATVTGPVGNYTVQPLNTTGTETYTLTGTGISGSLTASVSLGFYNGWYGEMTANPNMVIGQTISPTSSITFTMGAYNPGAPNSFGYDMGPDVFSAYTGNITWNIVTPSGTTTVTNTSHTYTLNATTPGNYNVYTTNLTGDPAMTFPFGGANLSFTVAAPASVPGFTSLTQSSSTLTYGSNAYASWTSTNAQYVDIYLNGAALYTMLSTSATNYVLSNLPVGTDVVSFYPWKQTTALGNEYGAPQTLTYTVSAVPATITQSASSFVYNGNTQKPTFKITQITGGPAFSVTATPSTYSYNGQTVTVAATSGTPSASAVGTYSVAVGVTGNYVGSGTFSWGITAEPAKIYEDYNGVSSFPYTGSPITMQFLGEATDTNTIIPGPLPVNVVSGTLTATNAGTYTVYVTPSGNYSGGTYGPYSWTITQLSSSLSVNSAPTGTVGVSENISVNTSNASGTLSWTIYGGSSTVTGSTAITGSTTLVPVTPTVATTYTIYLTASGDTNHTSATTNAQWGINPGNQTITGPGSTLTTSIGAPLTITVNGAGAGCSYSWNFYGGPDDPSVTYNNGPNNVATATFDTAGTYYLQVYSPGTDGNGNQNYNSSNYLSITITVSTIPTKYTLPITVFYYTGSAVYPMTNQTAVPSPSAAGAAGAPYVGGTSYATAIGNYNLTLTVPSGTNYGGTTTVPWSIVANPNTTSPPTTISGNSTYVDLSTLGSIAALTINGSGSSGQARIGNFGISANVQYLTAYNVYKSDSGDWYLQSLAWAYTDSNGDTQSSTAYGGTQIYDLGANPMVLMGTNYQIINGPTPIGGLDTVSPTVPAGGTLYATGWAGDFSNATATSNVTVKLYMDGTLIATAAPSSARPDVVKTYKTSAILNSGWTTSCVVPANTAVGSHVITALEYDAGGVTNIGAVTINVVAANTVTFTAVAEDSPNGTTNPGGTYANATYGQTILLAWNTPAGSTVTLSGPGISGTPSEPVVGSYSLISPAGNDYYTLSVTNGGSTTTYQAYAYVAKAQQTFTFSANSVTGATSFTTPSYEYHIPGYGTNVYNGTTTSNQYIETGTGPLVFTANAPSTGSYTWYNGPDTGAYAATGDGYTATTTTNGTFTAAATPYAGGVYGYTCYNAGDSNYYPAYGTPVSGQASASFPQFIAVEAVGPSTVTVTTAQFNSGFQPTTNFTYGSWIYIQASVSGMPATTQVSITGPGLSSPLIVNGQSYSQFLTAPAGTDTYTASYTNGAGVTFTGTVTVTVAPQATSTSASPLSFQYNGSQQGPTVSPSGATYNVTSGTLLATNPGSYSASWTLTGNYSGSGSANWAITAIPQSISWNPTPSTTTIQAGSSLAFSATGASAGYVWTVSPNGPTGIAGSGASQTITFPGQGTYTVSVTAATPTGYAASNTLTSTITVNAGPGGTAAISPAGSTIPAGTTVTFTASGGNGTGAYTWGGTGGATGTGTTKIVTFNTPGSQTVTVYRASDGAYLQSSTATVTMTVTAVAQTVSVTPATSSVNPGGAVTLTAGGGNTGYTWTVSPIGPTGISGTGAGQTITFPSSGTYTVSVYAPAGGIYAQSNTATTTVTVNTFPTTWTVNSTIFNYTGSPQSPTLTPNPSNATYSATGNTTETTAGSYTEIVTATGNYSGTQTINWTINQIAPPAVSLVANTATTIYMGGTISFTASGGAGTGAFTWSSSPSGPTPLTTGSSNLTITFPSLGTYTISVYKASDTNYTQSNTATVTVTVLWNLTVLASSGGSVTGGGTFSTNTAEPISATPNTNYAFAGWTPAGSVTNSETASTTVPPAGNVTVTANFLPVSGTPQGPIDFGSANAQGISGVTPSSSTRYEQVNNSGASQALYITGITTTGDFTPQVVASTSNPITISTNTNSSLPVVFAPTGVVPSTRTGVITMWTSDSQQPVIQYQLTGQALGDATPTVSASLITTGQITSGQTVVINVTGNSSTGTLNTIGVEVAGPGNATIGPSYYVPGGTTTSLSNNFSITLNAGGGTYTVYAYASDAAGLSTGWVQQFTISVQASGFQATIESQAYPAPGYEIWFTPSPVTTGTYTVNPGP